MLRSSNIPIRTNSPQVPCLRNVHLALQRDNSLTPHCENHKRNINIDIIQRLESIALESPEYLLDYGGFIGGASVEERPRGRKEQKDGQLMHLVQSGSSIRPVVTSYPRRNEILGEKMLCC